MKRSVSLIFVLFLLAGLLPGSAPAQAQGLTTDNPFLALFPELATLPAPSWVRERLRVSYYGASAAAYKGPDEPSTAGAGITQTDVVAMDRRSVALSTRFLLDLGGGTVQPSITVGEIGAPGVGPFWINPAVLVDAERVANEDLAVNHTTSTIEGVTYNVVRFDYSSQGATYAWVFEEATGLLLFHRFDMGEGGSKGHQQFVSMRRVRLPWRSNATPDWDEPGSEMRFEGNYWVLIPGGEPIGLPMAVTAKVKRVQPRWSLATVTDAVSGQASWPIDRVTGVAQLYEAFWLPAEALAASPRNPVLDRDPATGAEISYERSGGVVTLTEVGSTWTNTLTYDGQTGALLSIGSQKQVGISTITIELQRVQ